MQFRSIALVQWNDNQMKSQDLSLVALRIPGLPQLEAFTCWLHFVRTFREWGWKDKINAHIKCSSESSWSLQYRWIIVWLCWFGPVLSCYWKKWWPDHVIDFTEGLMQVKEFCGVIFLFGYEDFLDFLLVKSWQSGCWHIEIQIFQKEDEIECMRTMLATWEEGSLPKIVLISGMKVAAEYLV